MKSPHFAPTGLPAPGQTVVAREARKVEQTPTSVMVWKKNYNLPQIN